ncbi:gamma-glutamyl-gamma-aminobutyrate hydrolase family protein [Sciscionella marina]|uniref:gamma-glutamyl-gamma-aminobutyrate hydrolase family protein n=1 Tax=Sciscionella marina TaxID=508770 RepID=UPI000370899B|nr:gamma-glutamyl-gamma-aminobutyrate hydrolase family protein [Sciscionella marina]
MGTPLIGIVADRKKTSSGAWVDIEADTLPHTYARAIERAGGAPLLIPALAVHSDGVRRLLDAIDGLFLPGGRDLDATLYGGRPHAENDPPLRVRDELEIALVHGARARRMPIFGACRGLQVLNVALGGTLEQHLGDHLDLTPHRAEVGTFTSHRVRVTPGSRLAGVAPSGSFAIASHHHQSVRELGAGLIPVAHAEDGTVEAAETSDDSFCLGVQWHPEELLEPDGLALMRSFVDAARAHAFAEEV